MKKLLFVFAVGVLLLPFAPLAKSQEVSIDFFYNNLNGGSWIEVGNYGYCWQPDVAVSDPSWRPYSDGYWSGLLQFRGRALYRRARPALSYCRCESKRHLHQPNGERHQHHLQKQNRL